MGKLKKIIVILSIFCILAIITCVIMLTIINNNNTSIENDEPIVEEKSNVGSVKNVEDIKTVYNIGNCANTMIEEFYNNEHDYRDSVLLPQNLVKELDFDNGLKSFFIENAYLAEMDDGINVYFAKGYIICENGTKKITDNSIKKDIQLTIIMDTEYKTARLGLYGNNYKDIFSYNDDVSKTGILKTSGLKIKNTDSNNRQLSELLVDSDFYKNKTVDLNIAEKDLVRWYYMDYLTKLADENNQNLPDTITFSYAGSFEEGYTIMDSKNKEYFIKPSTVPMKYEVQVK